MRTGSELNAWDWKGAGYVFYIRPVVRDRPVGRKQKSPGVVVWSCNIKDSNLFRGQAASGPDAPFADCGVSLTATN